MLFSCVVFFKKRLDSQADEIRDSYAAFFSQDTQPAKVIRMDSDVNTRNLHRVPPFRGQYK